MFCLTQFLKYNVTKRKCVNQKSKKELLSRKYVNKSEIKDCNTFLKTNMVHFDTAYYMYILTFKKKF